LSPKPEPSDGLDEPVHHTLHAIREQLERLEQAAGAGERSISTHLEPAWKRATAGEQRLPVIAVIGAAIALQAVLPDRLAIRPSWLLPALEGALGIGLMIANPSRIDRTSRTLRGFSLLLIGLISLANGWSAAVLIHALVEATFGSSASALLENGADIYVTNILAFGLWYWEFDRGGPVARSKGTRPYPDFLFVQMTSPELAPPQWTSHLADYIWLSFTNATAFSPTDIMPMSRWAKVLMMQSAISLVTIGLVIARAVNILR